MNEPVIVYGSPPPGPSGPRAALDGARAGLPAAAIRYAPELGDRNAAPAGRPFVIPIEVSRQSMVPAAEIDSLGIEA